MTDTPDYTHAKSVLRNHRLIEGMLIHPMRHLVKLPEGQHEAMVHYRDMVRDWLSLTAADGEALGELTNTYEIQVDLQDDGTHAFVPNPNFKGYYGP